MTFNRTGKVLASSILWEKVAKVMHKGNLKVFNSQ